MEVWKKENANLALTNNMVTAVDTHLGKLALIRNIRGT